MRLALRIICDATRAFLQIIGGLCYFYYVTWNIYYIVNIFLQTMIHFTNNDKFDQGKIDSKFLNTDNINKMILQFK